MSDEADKGFSICLSGADDDGKITAYTSEMDDAPVVVIDVLDSDNSKATVVLDLENAERLADFLLYQIGAEP